MRTSKRPKKGDRVFHFLMGMGTFETFCEDSSDCLVQFDGRKDSERVTTSFVKKWEKEKAKAP